MTIASSLLRSLAAAALVLVTATAASALEKKAWTADGFAAMQAAGQAVVIHVTAPWCPTCKAQHKVIDDLAGKPELKDVTVLAVDFDSQKDVLRSLNVQSQSTLVVFKGRQEVGRSAGDTNEASITALVAKSI